MTNKDDAPKSSKAREITHPGMMGDGTEEQTLGETGIPKSRIKKDEVEAAFEKTNLKRSPWTTLHLAWGHELCHAAKIDLSSTVLSTLWHQDVVAANATERRTDMQIEPQITFEGSEPSDAARAQILSEIRRLETHNQRITGCRVAVIAPSHKQRHGTGFQVRISLTIPPHENVMVNHAPSDDVRHEHVEVAIKDAFSSARRQVDDLAK
jgi:hypothetical protein